MFDERYGSSAKPFQRVKYGTLNAVNTGNGILQATCVLRPSGRGNRGPGPASVDMHLTHTPLVARLIFHDDRQYGHSYLELKPAVRLRSTFGRT